MKNINDIEIYRITHIDNIPHILKNGITHKDSLKKNLNYKNIGDISLISIRSSKKIGVSNCEDNVVKEINLGDFIPFYFDVRMPMLYV
ncbi:MAG TPA: DarT ssDNA thymidine ADP-ribosyltransferase family protein, partial [Bacteroidales bacterium]|nr:DarT ssDNA thymidine ADP-ribosyltransferase family protein [Bacteroidales bacterium]